MSQRQRTGRALFYADFRRAEVPLISLFRDVV